MRGSRFGRPAVKRKVAKERREHREAATFFAESSPVDLDQVRSVTLNSLEHLGIQRFLLPPFSEHFQRWVRDVKAVLTDFEAQLPEPIGGQFMKSVEEKLSDLEAALQERARRETDVSAKLSDAQRQLNGFESKRSKLDSDYKTGAHETRRRYEQSFDKLRREIVVLDAERLTILHRKPSLLQKLFRRPEANLEEKASSLRSKKTSLTQRTEALTKDLELKRAEYENKRSQITEQISVLRAKLDESTESKVDDALEIRKTACEDLRREVEGAVAVILKQQDVGQA